MGLRRIGIIEMRVADWAASLKWYTETLGLEAEVIEDDDQYAWLKLPDGDTRIALFSAARAPESEAGTRCLPSLETDDLAATVDELRQRGITVVRGPKASDEGYSTAHILDADGNIIELYEFVRPSPA